ncbi:MAG: RHS repeat protein, partial [Clostridia bacterium]|nr:RHS repeat protein [Clostridia bacterium]
MKNISKLTAFVLSFVMLVCFLPQSIMAEIGDALQNETLESALHEISNENVSENNEAYVLGEVVGKRTETSKTFRMSDGSFVAAEYGNSVHYADANGEWKEYDNTLTYSENVVLSDSEDFAGYVNAASDVSVKLAANAGFANHLRVSKNGYSLSLKLENAVSKNIEPRAKETKALSSSRSIEAASRLENINSSAVYKDILPSTDLEYILTGSKVKENIIVKSRSTAYSYSFVLTLKNLIPVLCENGNILLNDKTTGKSVFVIPAGYMYDAIGEDSNAVSYAVAPKGNDKYTLTVTADSEWINAKERAFPVTIDPTVEAFETRKNTRDTNIFESTPNKIDNEDDQLRIGYGSSGKAVFTLIKPTELPEIPKSAVITASVLRLRHNGMEGSNSVTALAMPISVEWASESTSWNSFFSTANPYNADDILDYAVLSSATSGTLVDFDITRLVQEWYADILENDVLLEQYDCKGIILVPQTKPSSGYGYARMASAEATNSNYMPQLLIHYRDTKGIEGIWTYSTQSAGSAGVGYVNGFNGNLVFANADMSSKGIIMPITVSHVYNSALSNGEFNSSMLIGKGWKLNVQETVKQTTIGENTYYIHNDADGTEHYYYNNNGIYTDESGTGNTITVGSSGFTLNYETGGSKSFDSSGRLIELTDVHGNVRSFTYDTSERLITIALKAVGLSKKSQIRLFYNDLGALKYMFQVNNTNEMVKFYYSETYNGTISADASGYLRKIEHCYGTEVISSCSYEYDGNGNLLKAKDNDTGYNLQYAYTNGKVSSVTEYGNLTTGQTVRYNYGDKLFSVRMSGNDDIIGNTDDISTVYVFDNYGKATCAYSMNSNTREVYGASYAEYTATETGSKLNNKLKTESVKGYTKTNLFDNGNLSSLSGWYIDDAGATVSLSTEKSFYGASSLKLSSNSENRIASLNRDITIAESGTYTLSMYVKAENVVSSSNGGFSFSIGNNESETITGTTDESVNGGWRRISLTAELTAGNLIDGTIFLMLQNASGTVYIDCIQLEKGDALSEFNFIQNSGVKDASFWGDNVFHYTADQYNGSVGRVSGNPAQQIAATQTVNVNTPTDVTFMLSGWGKANSVKLPNGDTDAARANRKFGLKAVLTYSDASTEEHYVSFNDDNVEWQYAALAIVPKTENKTLTVQTVTVSFVYDYNANYALFDDITLTVEASQTYAYDSDGNLKTATDAEGNQSAMDYAENAIDLEKFTAVTGEEYNYTYVGNTHLVDTATKTSNGITQTLDYTYNAFGNVVSTVLTATGTEESVTSSALYSADGNFLTQTVDSLGGVTKYNYESLTKLLSYVENANSVQTAYIYDNAGRTNKVYLDADKDGVADTAEPAVEYLYANNRLSGIQTATTGYTLTYDAFGNMLSVKAGDNVLATYTYSSNNGKLARLTYGNGDYEEYFYDYLERIEEVKFNGAVKYSIQYDANGNIHKIFDGNVTHQYEYDSLGRLIRAYQKDSSGNVTLAVENSYDTLGRSNGSSYVVNDRAFEYGITYKEDSNLVSSYTLPGATQTYTYDSFDRLSSKLAYRHYIAYTYVSGSSLVASRTLSLYDGSVLRFDYTYDAVGNLLTVTRNNVLSVSYEYDSLNQLIRENDNTNNRTVLYVYDNAGNLTTRYTFPYSTLIPEMLFSTYPSYATPVYYGYSGDRLTTYNGVSITYDTIGNPTKWHNATSMSWDGRELISQTLSNGTVLSYAYNSSGIRTQKTYGSSYRKDYLLDGTTIVAEIKTNLSNNSKETIYYFYDETGVAGFEYNGAKYHYVKNLQGDIISIQNANGIVVVNYA